MGQRPDRRSPTTFREALAAEIVAESAASGISTEELARLIGISERQLIRVRGGQRALDTDQIELAAAAFGIRPGVLFRRAEDRLTAAAPSKPTWSIPPKS